MTDMDTDKQPEQGHLWQCDECGVARPILDDDWTCDCPATKVEEAFVWNRIKYEPATD